MKSKLKKKEVRRRDPVIVEYRMILDLCRKGKHSKCKGKIVVDPFTSMFCKCSCHKKVEEVKELEDIREGRRK